MSADSEESISWGIRKRNHCGEVWNGTACKRSVITLKVVVRAEILPREIFFKLWKTITCHLL